MDTRRIAGAIVAVLGLVVPLLGVATSNATAATPSAAVKYANAAHAGTNAVRAKRGLSTLRKNTCLQKLARVQAERMAKARRLSHQNLRTALKKCRMGVVGENVAEGFHTGSAVVGAWMRSPGHRANILAKRYRLMGIAAVKRHGVWYVAQVFGRRLPAR